MLGFLAKAALTGPESALLGSAISAVTQHAHSDRYGALLSSLDKQALPGIVKQLQGTEALSPFLRDALAIVRQSAEKGYLPTLVGMALDSAQAKGYEPEVMAGLASKIAKMLRIKVSRPTDDSPTARVTAVVSSIASAHAEVVHGIGGVSICPKCGFAHLI